MNGPPSALTQDEQVVNNAGEEAAYTWMLDGHTIRVSLGEEDSETYFQAALNEDNSQYVGTWHYADGDPPDATETIIYTRVDGKG
jgi:hypothetical protein